MDFSLSLILFVHIIKYNFKYLDMFSINSNVSV